MKRLPTILVAACTAALALLAWLPPAARSAPATEGPTTALLRKLIAIDTSHPPTGRDQSASAPTLALAELLRSQLAPLGAQITVYKGERGAAHFIARLRSGIARKPVLLAAHADVVPADRARWSVDPFQGVLRDGWVYGRGAIDFKGGLAVFTRAVMMLAENHVPLSRDVVLLAEADEEEGTFDTDWLAEHHWADIDAEFVLNEGGWILQGPGGAPQIVDITVADRVAVNVTLTARGTSTHASRPLPADQTAVGRLVRALSRLSQRDFEPRLTPQTRNWFLALANVSGEPLGADLRTLALSEDPAARAAAATRVVQRSRYPTLVRTLMRDSVAVTLVDAGVKRNVIPGVAQANLNVRMLPGTTTDDVIARLKDIVDDPAIEIALDSKRLDARDYFLSRTRIPPSSTDTLLYRSLARQARRQWPGVEVVPALFEAGTDAMPWRTRGIPVYGVYPYPVDNDTLLRMHGDDERVGVAQLEQGTAWIYATLREVAGR